MLGKYFKQQDGHYINTKRLVVEAISTNGHHAIDHIVPKGSVWQTDDNGCLVYKTEHGVVNIDPTDAELAVEDEGSVVIVSI